MKDIKIGIKVDDKQAVAGLNSVGKEIDKLAKKNNFGSGMSSAFAGIGDKAKAMGGKLAEAFGSFPAIAGTASMAIGSIGVAVGAASLAITKMSIDLAKSSDEIFKASQRMGVSIEFYQKMSSAAGHAGTTAEAMGVAMNSLITKLPQVTAGSKEVIGAFDRIGVSVKDVNGQFKSQEQIFSDTLIGLAGMKNATERSAVATKLLGEQAKQLAPIFNEGADAVRRYISSNNSAVGVSQKLAEASAKYNDNMQTVNETLTKAKNEALTPFVEMLAVLSDNLLNSEGFKSFIGWINKTGEALAVVAQYATDLSKGFAIGELEKKQEQLNKNMERGSYLIQERNRYQEVYNRTGYEGAKASADAKNKEMIALSKTTIALKSVIDSETKRLYGANEFKKVSEEIVTVTDKNTTSNKKLNDEYARQKQLISELSSSLSEHVSNINKVRDLYSKFEISGLEKVTYDVKRTFIDLEMDLGLSIIKMKDKVVDLQNTLNVETDPAMASSIKRTISEIESDVNRFSEVMAKIPVYQKKAMGEAINEFITAQDAWLIELADGVNELETLVLPTETSTSIWGRIFNVTGEDEANMLNGLDMAKVTLDASMSMFGAISDFRQQKDQQALDSWKSGEQERLSTLQVTSRRMQIEQKKIDAEEERRKKENFGKSKALKIAEIQLSAGSAIMSAWASAMQVQPLPLGIALGAGTIAMLATTAMMQSAQVAKQAYAGGGIVGDAKGASMGPDNKVATIREGEMILNAKQQQNLFKIVDKGQLTNGGINIHIGGNVTQDHLQQLKDDLESLRSYGQLAF